MNFIYTYFFGLKLFIICSTLFTLTLSDCFSQVGIYNLPPGESIPKDFVFVDYSYKLQNSSIDQIVAYASSQDFLYFLTFEQLDLIKRTDNEKFEYYQSAKRFYEQLTQYTKTLFTLEELWYIYKYDAKLKEKLVTLIELK